MPSALPSPALAARIAAIAAKGIDLKAPRPTPAASPFWAGLRAVGSELWLDTGDLDAAAPLWNAEFTALTTNNTLLNKEVQKGIYDALVKETAAALSDLDPQSRVIEIAFILNAHHGLRLAQRFGGKVSVELHTDLAHDAERSIAYGKRFFAICPEHFIVKLPFTAAGLLAAKALGEAKIPVNFTLGFGARHNYLATAIAAPAYVNVFLGRLNAYMTDNKLGDGKLVGEKSMLASQRAVTALNRGTRHIAASLRNAQQLADLGGIDVFTMPTPVAAEAVKTLDGKWINCVAKDYPISVLPGVDIKAIRLHTLWDIGPAERAFAADFAAHPATTAEELIDRAHKHGVGDLFPRLSAAELKTLSDDGKIPKHATWAAKIAAGELAIDTVLNLAALASFVIDQTALDDRIRKQIG